MFSAHVISIWLRPGVEGPRPIERRGSPRRFADRRTAPPTRLRMIPGASFRGLPMPPSQTRNRCWLVQE